MSTINDPSSPEYRKARRQYLKSTKHRNNDPHWAPFRTIEKKYKARFPPPDLSNVLDLAVLNSARAHELEQGAWKGYSNAEEHREMPISTGAAYMIPRIPGLVIIPSFLSHEQQRDLIRWSLADQARTPNNTNLDAHYALPNAGIWNTWLRVRDDPSQDSPVHPRSLETPPENQEPSGPRQLVQNIPANPANYTAIALTPKPPQAPSPNTQAAPLSTLIKKLRWANIGWYYHWGTKQYDFTKGRVPVDERVKNLCQQAVASVNWGRVFGNSSMDWDGEPDWESWHDTYEPDAGIVNFYQEKDTLMAHVDRSEVCTTSPLVSISLGNAAIFLIGGQTRDVEPVPVLLRSGDVVIMSGPECRRSYHGVPRILEGTLPPHLQNIDSDWQPYEDYIRSTRININVRQVFPKGFDPVL